MFNSLRNRVGDWLEGLARSPQQASHAVFASILIIGIFALTLDLGPRMAPDYFEARLLDPLDKDTLDSAKAAKKALISSATNQTAAKTTCATARADGSYNTLLNNFESSFAGILPGAGNLLLEHPSTVNNRRKKLIFEIMKKYANLKFCIPEDQFKLVYLADYKNVIAQLNSLFQVVLYEKDQEKTEAEKENLSFDQNNPVFISTAAGEYILVEKDLISTHKYVTEVIDRAIESAIELDRQTQVRVANLTRQTSNHLLENIIKQQNENIEIDTSAAILLQAIRDQDATENPYGGTTSSFTSPAAYSGKKQESGLPDGNSLFAGKKIPTVSFGLLNLLTGGEREGFLANHYAIEMVFYLAAKYSFDPLAPENANALVAAKTLKYDENVYKGQMMPLFKEDISTGLTGSHSITASKTQPTPTETKLGGGSTNVTPYPIEPAPVNIRLQELPFVNIDIVKQTLGVVNTSR